MLYLYKILIFTLNTYILVHELGVMDVEVSPSNRATCRYCDERISKNELRTRRSFNSGYDTFTTWYYHLRCEIIINPDCIDSLKLPFKMARELENYLFLPHRNKKSVSKTKKKKTDLKTILKSRSQFVILKRLSQDWLLPNMYNDVLKICITNNWSIPTFIILEMFEERKYLPDQKLLDKLASKYKTLDIPAETKTNSYPYGFSVRYLAPKNEKTKFSFGILKKLISLQILHRSVTTSLLVDLFTALNMESNLSVDKTELLSYAYLKENLDQITPELKELITVRINSILSDYPEPPNMRKDRFFYDYEKRDYENSIKSKILVLEFVKQSNFPYSVPSPPKFLALLPLYVMTLDALNIDTSELKKAVSNTLGMLENILTRAKNDKLYQLDEKIDGYIQKAISVIPKLEKISVDTNLTMLLDEFQPVHFEKNNGTVDNDVKFLTKKEIPIEKVNIQNVAKLFKGLKVEVLYGNYIGTISKITSERHTPAVNISETGEKILNFSWIPIELPFEDRKAEFYPECDVKGDQWKRGVLKYGGEYYYVLGNQQVEWFMKRIDKIFVNYV